MELSLFTTRAPFDTALATLGLKLAGVDSLPFLLPSGTQLPVQFAGPGAARRRLLQLELLDPHRGRGLKKHPVELVHVREA